MEHIKPFANHWKITPPGLIIESMKRYEEVPHTADLAAKIYGKDLEELFANAAYAMFSMIADVEGVELAETVKIGVEAPDTESLLVVWLNELLYAAFSKKMIFCDFKFNILEEERLVAEVKGQKIEKNSEKIYKEIKAATYHDLKIKKTGKGYEVTVVFDV